MSAETNRLKAKEVMSRGPGRHPDGNGLYLVVSKGGGRSWSLVFSFQNKQREMGLGYPPDVGLGAAREAAVAMKKLAKAGTDPIEARRLEKAPQVAAAPVSAALTFGDFADQRIEDMAPRWDSPKTRPSWENSINKWAAPIRNIPLAEIAVEDVLRCIRSDWLTTPIMVQASQERIEQVLDAAIALRLRPGPNPAAWSNNLEHILSPKVKRKKGPHAALAYEEAPAFFRSLETNQGFGVRALEFTMLTAVRSAQAAQARWDEVDLKAALWRVPLERVKIRKFLRENGHGDFTVPLSRGALAVLRRTAEAQFAGGKIDPRAWLFPGEVEGKHISNGTMERVLDRAEVDVTVHGFRSTFRDWAGEKMIVMDGVERRAYSDEGCEISLGHIVGDTARRAYRRGQALRERSVIMSEWGDYLTGGAAALAVAA